MRDGKRWVLAGIFAAASMVGYACVGDDSSSSDGGGDGSSDVTTSPDVGGDTGGGDGGGGCDAGQMMCSGTCVDTSTDEKNCGRCAHDCTPGACSGSVCQAALIAGNADAGDAAAPINSLTTDQTDDNPAGAAKSVFWSATGVTGGVFQDSTLGGNTIKISTTSVTALTNVVVNQSTAHWFVQNFGGPPQPVFKGTVGSAGSQTADGTFNCAAIQSILYDPTSQGVYGSYAVNLSSLGVFKCINSTCTMVTSSAGQPGGNVAMDATHIYYSDPNDGLIEWATFTGNAGTYIQSQASPTLLRVDGTNLYWFDSGNKAINRAALVSPTPKTLATAATPADAIAADGVNVYWVESATGTVNYAPVTGSGPTTPYVTLGPSATPMHLVRDSATLYFSYNGGIYRVALP